ncbi:hypothetical protein [Enterococcus sp. HY326]|uniref:hypothetical protein n=1 Tax=Enterococcus sp. HY326 TaxID=2971265 RepID=UPI00223F2C1D|nr:hypothetical protein [Enterococcus sp. HY326]
MSNNWLSKMMSSYLNYRKFMTGRYGSFDTINRALLVVALIALLFRRWLNGYLVLAIVALTIGLIIFRFLSKKIYVRSNENQRLSRFFAGAAQRNSEQTHERHQRNAYKKAQKQQRQAAKMKNQRQQAANIQAVIFKCDNCGQSLRVPQGKGKIKITCKNCQHTFIKET